MRCQRRHIREVAVLIGVVKAISDDKLVWDVETDIFDIPFPDPANCKNTMIKPMHNRIQIRGPLKMRDAFFIDYLEA